MTAEVTLSSQNQKVKFQLDSSRSSWSSLTDCLEEQSRDVIIAQKMLEILESRRISGGESATCPHGCTGIFSTAEWTIEGGTISRHLHHLIEQHNDYGPWDPDELLLALKV